MSTVFPLDGWPLPVNGDLRVFGAAAILAVLLVFGVLAVRVLQSHRTRRAA